MKLGFGFYRHMLNCEHFDFAVQCGATHAVVHLVDYFHKGAHRGNNQPVGDLKGGWGFAGGTPDESWSADSLKALRAQLNEAGLVLEAIENFDPAHWHDVLLDGPRKEEQIDRLKQIVRNVGAAGIAVFGYNFSLAGVCGRVTSNTARGSAETVGMNDIDECRIMEILKKNDFDGVLIPDHTPQMSCDAPWHAGMAYAMGFMKAMLPKTKNVLDMNRKDINE